MSHSDPDSNHYVRDRFSAAASIVSLLVLFSIQHMTNRQTKAILLKLDELVEAVDGADNDVIAMEDRGLEDQEDIRDRHQR